ncbi:right-handed parallel beta-helix repeat-containing protein [Hamadaea tsunoensis]|uniref:right-handed parallel beta-helix repeat-containing protein n=1 Tax=Hamadaea tsunoensis TaxID=53368 RepID=UPI0004057147|nr:right-handed parallel beta-helix repeat-containing protein [Hamadaea tsunoensis]
MSWFARRRSTVIRAVSALVVAVGAAGLVLAATAQAATLFSATFEDGTLNAWSKSGGTWSVVADGSQVAQQANTTTNNARLFAGDTSWTDYVVQARVKPLSIGSGGHAALLGRATGSTTFYRLAVVEAGQVQLQQVWSGTVTVLATSAQPVAAGWSTLALSIVGSTLTGSVNGTTVVSATDARITQGRIGLQTAYASAEFDDVTVSSAGSSPSPTASASTVPSSSPSPSRSAGPSPSASPSASPSPSASTPSGTLFVATNGNDGNAGTLAAPFATVQKAVSVVAAGGTIAVRGGTYALTTNITIAKSGTAAAPITLTNYNGEHVTIDGEGLAYTPGDVGSTIPAAQRGAVHMSANFWRITGLEIEHGPYAVYCDGCNDNVFDRLVTHDNYESGFQLQGTSARNQILNLDSYANRDPRKNGESADGLAIKQGGGSGNLVRGARLWNNSDDGFDAWLFTSPITIQDSVAYGNGYNRWSIPNYSGDGNGWKLGGSDTTGPAAAHTVSNSMAWGNSAAGFTDNGNTGAIVVNRCTAYDNVKTGFDFDGGSVANLTANLAVGNAAPVALGSSTASGNSWNIGGTWTLQSTDASTITGARTASGAIPTSVYLVPANGAAVGAHI